MQKESHSQVSMPYLKPQKAYLVKAAFISFNLLNRSNIIYYCWRVECEFLHYQLYITVSFASIFFKKKKKKKEWKKLTVLVVQTQQLLKLYLFLSPCIFAALIQLTRRDFASTSNFSVRIFQCSLWNWTLNYSRSRNHMSLFYQYNLSITAYYRNILVAKVEVQRDKETYKLYKKIKKKP